MPEKVSHFVISIIFQELTFLVVPRLVFFFPKDNRDKKYKSHHLLLILQSYDWLAAFYLELLEAILFIAVLTLRRLMSYIYGAPILDVSRSHTTTQHSR